MDAILSFINAGASALIALVLMGLILSPKVHDGVVIKAGLIPMAMGFGSVAILMLDGIDGSKALGLSRALLLINAGLALVIVGYLLRKARSAHPVRRITDWADLVDGRTSRNYQ